MTFRRTPFDADGRVFARRELRMGERVYTPGQELAAADREQLAGRLGSLWDQGLIDTLPRKQPQQQPARR